ncbi:MAG: hypothetical protein H5T44_03505 [Thermoplasmatales archaeon]|nr:hypothetical protein [Thermoplasmatales archaeon]
MKVISFAPSHITGFFEIFLKESSEKSGSRGAGLCISLGSYAIAEKISGKKMVAEGNIGKGEVTKLAIKRIASGVKVKIKNQLPFSQGFGISASSSLSSCLAVAELLGIDRSEAIRAAHYAELKSGTGLGDVVTSARGGMEIRLREGIGGEIKKIELNEKIIVGIVGKKIHTKSILEDEKKREIINDIGKDCLKKFLRKPDIENFFDLSLYFAENSGLMSEKVKKVLKHLNKIGKASMCMIGNSVFAIYNKEIEKYLSRYESYVCNIDNYGARVLATFFP